MARTFDNEPLDSTFGATVTKVKLAALDDDLRAKVERLAAHHTRFGAGPGASGAAQAVADCPSPHREFLRSFDSNRSPVVRSDRTH
jgi:hypothetical protein